MTTKGELSSRERDTIFDVPFSRERDTNLL